MLLYAAERRERASSRFVVTDLLLNGLRARDT